MCLYTSGTLLDTNTQRIICSQLPPSGLTPEAQTQVSILPAQDLRLLHPHPSLTMLPFLPRPNGEEVGRVLSPCFAITGSVTLIQLLDLCEPQFTQLQNHSYLLSSGKT